MLEILIGFVVFVFSVIIHENAHGVVAEKFGDPTARSSGRITMNPLPHVDPVGSVIIPVLAYINNLPFIGWAKPVPVNPANLRNPFVHNAYVAAAGPLSNLLLITAGTLLWIVVGAFFKHVPILAEHGGKTLEFFSILFSNLIIINSVLAVFNLIPIPPLDGHWILFRFLPPDMGEKLMMIRPYGFLILIVLLMTGVLGRIIALPIHLIYNKAVDFVVYMIGIL